MRHLVTIWLTLGVVAVAASQETPPIRRFTPKTYGGQNQNWSLAQGASGEIYAGNNGGVMVFDGARWRIYPLPERQTVRTVAAGPDGRIYCGGFAEFGYWLPDSTGSMKYYSLSQQVRAEQVEREEIWHILIGEHFALFQSFSTLYKYDYRQAPVVLQPPGAVMFAQLVRGRVLLPVIGQGVYELLADNTFRFIEGSEALGNAIVQFIVPGPNDAIWIGTANEGLFELQNNICQPWSHPLNAVFRKSQLNKAVALRQGGWALGTILHGVYVLDKQQRLRFHLHRENGLQNNTVLALMEDCRGGLWIGLDRGIDLVSLRSPVVFYTDLTGKIGAVYAAALWKNRLYLGTNQGLFVQQGSGFHLIEGTQGQVWELRAAKGQLLCGHNSGTFIVQGTSIYWLSAVTGGWCTVAPPGHDNLLLQSTYTGLVLYEYQASQGWRLLQRVEGFNEPLRKIAFDSGGVLWGVHPSRGVYRLRLSGDLCRVLEYRLFRRGDAGLLSDYALDLTRIQGQLVLNVHATPFAIRDSAGHVAFVSLIAPNLRQKWLCDAGTGLFYTDESGVVWQTSQERYVISTTLVPGYERIEHLRDDEYLLCLEDGYARLRLSDLSNYRLERASIQLQYIETTARCYAISPEETIELPFAENDLRVVFSIPVFEQSPRFRWQLVGIRPPSPWQEEAEIKLDNLKPGHYTLLLETDVHDQAVAFSLRIRPPWYQTTWAFCAYGLLLLLAVLSFEKISQHRLRRQRERLQAEKEQELTHQRLAAEHERFALELANKNRELSNAALNLVRKNEVLRHLRSQLLQHLNEPNALRRLIREIDQHLEGEHDWALFETAFNEVHDGFFKRLLQQYPNLTPGDLRLAAYLKLNLSSKEIAPLLNISLRGVENKRYRLRKKLGLSEDANLTEFIINF
ncbi:MAG: hypothetical protein NZM43_13510 [Saprospiraceae bacterium]|nr:hypothetical protein [Saprospiraceae bacterium]MDW8485331.1 hypothetical protein [Saprospiraceae bacterium]